MPRGKGVKRKSRTAPRAAPYTRQRGDSEAEAASTPEPVADQEPEFVQLAGDNAHPPGNVFGALLASNLPCNNFDIPDSISCVDDDLAMHVPADICKQIWLHKYVNLAQLLKSDSRFTPTSSLVLGEQGNLELRPKSQRSLNTIREWTDAFVIFMSIYIKKHPMLAGDLLQYMAIIREAEGRSSGSMSWKTYDENFRMRQAIKPQSWASIHPDLWLRTMTLTTSTTTGLYDKHPLNVTRNAGRRPQGLCQEFNREQNGCTWKNCKYNHKCQACRGDHPEFRCPRMMSRVGPSQPASDQTFRGFRTQSANTRGTRGGWQSKNRY